ncbi:PNK3P-domain-containing protein [Lentinus tigrinus ALCF2SS1-7]|uniref:PNK3P-domain-containing protein n=1 Tax=Lentinus tigrinus ALCF2SS1-6 TaxID=1328759 RepID=A0A5C2SR22_9APHY|nr:PNK3P-domain-containing protein [Lentinus tigrinus ALCF2SS1-6]RPD79747.1 PNK3P-domain-containing protein [Lentinus tigrinus ALCF2SS1-7]
MSKAQTKKRAADDQAGPDPKQQKLFPIFSKAGELSGDSSQSGSSFRWITPALGPKRSCLHGVNGAPRSLPKVAAFDLDGCLIQSSFPKKGAPPKFEWWRKDVPKKLKEVHAQGYSVVIITNQALRTSTLISEWKKKIPLIANALSEVPFRIFAAIEKDGYRKPIPGMWYELERIFAEDDVQIDVASSFFVGDAAGRPNDHSSTDRKLALNIGIPFYTPEEYFLKLPTAKYTLPGFHVSSLPTEEKRIVPSKPSLLPSSSTPELVLFVGYPALGKSSFFRTHFAPAGYTHVNQDTLKTRDKCVKATAEALQNGQNVVVDNTNRDVQTRKYYVDLAKKQGVPIRCVYFTGSLELAWHNNLYRAFNLPASLTVSQPTRELLPCNAFTSFRANFQEPTIDEGFYEVRRVNWQFEGHEDARKRWSMWLQIDGK